MGATLLYRGGGLMGGGGGGVGFSCLVVSFGFAFPKKHNC